MTLLLAPLAVVVSALMLSTPAIGEESESDVTVDIDNVRLDTVQISGQEEPLATISTAKLLRVPGAGYDPLQAIGSLPGVTYAGGSGAQPAVRGSSPDDNGYFIDFLPVGYIFHSDTSSIVSDNLLQDFRLEKAAFSPQYNNATGSIIDVTSRSPYYDRSQLIIDASLLKAGIFYEQPVNENQSFYFAARQSLFQFYIENFLDSDDFEFTTVPEYYDYQGKYEWRITTTDRLAFQVVGARDKAGLLFSDDSDQVQQDPGLAGGINVNSRFHSQGLLWEKFYSNGLTHKVGLSRMEQLFNLRVGTGIAIDATQLTYNFRSQFNLPISIDHELQWGLEYSENHLDYDGAVSTSPCNGDWGEPCNIGIDNPTITGAGSLIIRNYDAHLADSWQVTQDWTLTPALAFSWDDFTSQTFVEPRLHSRWQFTDDWWFNAAYGHHHQQSPNFDQFIEPFGNEDLKQSTAIHYELGIEQQVRTDLLWKLDIYYKALDNIPIAVPDDPQFTGYPRYVNEAEGEAWGMELFVNKNLTDKWYGWVSVAYSRTTRHDNLINADFPYTYDKPLIINAVTTWQVNENWQIGFKWRLQSGQLITPLVDAIPDPQPGYPENYQPIYGETNSDRLPVYHKLDFRADRTFRFNGWEMDFYAEALNLYARKNVLGYSYKGADYSEREEQTDLPFMLSLGIKARL